MLRESCSVKEGPGVTNSAPGSPGDGNMEEEEAAEGSVLRWRSSVRENVSTEHLVRIISDEPIDQNGTGFRATALPFSPPFCTTGDGLRGDESRTLYKFKKKEIR